MDADICLTIGKRLRALRKAHGWRQIDLSEHSKVHEVHISDLERGTREVGIRTLASLASALGVSMEALFKDL